MSSIELQQQGMLFCRKLMHTSKVVVKLKILVKNSKFKIVNESYSDWLFYSFPFPYPDAIPGISPKQFLTKKYIQESLVTKKSNFN